MSRPPSTPGVKSEPRDSPLPTPHSAGAAHLDMGLRRGRSDDDQGCSASPRVRDINLGQSLFKRARPDSPAEISSSKYKATSGRPERLAIDLSQDIDDEDYDPFAYRPEFEKGNKLRFDELDEDQKRVVELAIRGRKNICCVGGAGTGKSQTCEMIVDGYSDARVRIAIVAPSGTAAVNVKAQTLHSFFGLGASTNKGIEELTSSMKRNVRERIDNTDVLVIDEISMVSNETFDRMDQLARVARDEPEKPFGGMQIIVFGDFCQLPPVKPHEHCYQCGKKRELVTLPKRKRGKTGQRVWRCTEHGDIQDGDKMWAFKSARWDTTGFEYIQLTHVHRQQDPTFLNNLANVRFGKPFTPVEVDLLTNHDCDVKNAVELTAKRVEAGKINDERIKRLPAVEHEYECQDDFDWREDLHPELDQVYQNKRRALWEHPYEVIVRLKQNEPVILQRNINVRKGLVNGSQGVIQHFVDYDEVHHQHDRSLEDDNIGPDRFKHVKDFMKSQRRAGLSTVLPVVKFNNYPDLVTVYPDCSVTELGFKKPHSLLTRTQVPLLAGWALTIHKAQGMTLEKAIVDLADCFQCGMAYVALSRVKTLAGLKVKGLRQSTMVHAVDEEVKGFMQLHFGADFD